MTCTFTDIIIAIMKKHKIKSIEVEFNGEGDSGCFEYPRFNYCDSIKQGQEYFKAVDDDLKKLVATFDDDFVEANNLSDYVEKQDDKYLLDIKKGNYDSSLHKFLYDFSRDYLENNYGGWEDNEGSSGKFVWDLEKENCTLHRQVPVTEYEEFEENI